MCKAESFLGCSSQEGNGLVWHGAVQWGMALCGVVWCGVMCGVVGYGMCGMMCGMVCGMVWCGMV